LGVGGIHDFEQLEGGTFVQISRFRIGLLGQQPFKHRETVLYTGGTKHLTANRFSSNRTCRQLTNLVPVLVYLQSL